MSDSQTGERFVIYYPAYTVVMEDAIRQRDLASSIPMAPCEPFGDFLPLFTDEDLARLFIEEVPWIGARPFELPDKESLHELLTELRQRGCVYVGVDVRVGGPGPQQGRFFTIDKMLAGGDVYPEEEG